MGSGHRRSLEKRCKQWSSVGYKLWEILRLVESLEAHQIGGFRDKLGDLFQLSHDELSRAVRELRLAGDDAAGDHVARRGGVE